MSKAYLVVFESAFADRQKVIDTLDAIPEIPFWYACLPNCVFFTASVVSQVISEQLERVISPEGNKKYAIFEIGSDSQGRLPKQAWHLMQHPDDPRLKPNA